MMPSLRNWPVKEIPVQMSDTPPYIGGIYNRHGPNYGEDTEDVLRRIVHLSPAEMAALPENHAGS